MIKLFARYLPVLLIGMILFSRCSDDEPVIDTDDPDNNNQPVVVVPNNFLSENKYDQLTIEIVYVDGFKPQAASVDHLKTFLGNRIRKSKGISVSYASIPSPGKSSYSLTDLREIEEKHRTKFPSGKQLTAWFFFADADYAGNEGNYKTLGVAYGSTSMAIFEKTIKEFTGGLGQPPLNILETTVLEHEFCHIMGLVNNGTSMVENHQDVEHKHHCNNEDCLMYYAAETSNFIGNFLGGEVPSLDDQCVNDLKNNGGK